MIYYSYDGSLEGFLCCIETSIRLKERPLDFIVKEDTVLLGEIKKIETDEKIAENIFKTIQEYDLLSAKYFLAVFFSEKQNREILLLDFFNQLEEKKFKTMQNLSNPIIFEVYQVARKVFKEIHCIKGFIRFQTLKENLLYAAIEPQYNILSFIAPHFVRRFPLERWIIHDKKRNFAIYYDKQKWFPIELEKDFVLPLEEEQIHYEKLWKSYFQHIAIPERKNPNLQKKFLPIRYWKYLTEKKQ